MEESLELRSQKEPLMNERKPDCGRLSERIGAQMQLKTVGAERGAQ